MKRISIITVNRNNARELARTIRSVELYAPESCEYIVIDGASTDASVAAIEASPRVSTWVSEPDSGIYHAMNKGIARATGEYCLFLNSGDYLRQNNGLAELPDDVPEVFYSDAVIVNRDSRQTIRYPDSLDVNFFVSGMINHQNALIRRELFDRLGFYDEAFKICADWLFFLKAAHEEKARFVHLPKIMVEFTNGGVSSRPGSDELLRQESKTGLQMVFGELAPSILELQSFRESTYGNIIHLYGSEEALEVLLKCYRYILRRIKRFGKFGR